MADPPDTENAQGSRGRLLIAVGAMLLLAAVVTVAALTASSGSPAEEDPDDCVEAWNASRTAIADGLHAVQAHDYGPVEVTRVDDEGKPIGTDSEEGRCAVVFAAEKVDFEPDFGVRVYASGRWTGLFYSDAVPVEEIARIQRDAVAGANATLQPDGTLVSD